MTPEELLDDLRAAGTLDSQGQFTLSGEKALEKLRHHQLRDGSHYLLFALRAVVAAGARTITLRHSPTCIRVEAEGWQPPDRTHLLGGVFASPDEHPVDYYLGVVANHVALEVDSRGLTMRHPFSPRRVLRFLGEKRLLGSLRTTAPIAGLRAPARPPGETERSVPFMGQACHGELTPFLESPATSHAITIYKHGLPVQSQLYWLGGPFVSGWVEADGLRLDVSGQAVIQDERWLEVWKDLEEGLGRVVQDLCRPHNRRDPLIQRLLMRALVDRARGSQAPARVKVPVQLAYPPAEIVLPLSPAMGHLVSAPLIELEDEPPISARELAQQVLKGKEPVLALVPRGVYTKASRLGVTALPLLECWPSKQLT